MAENDKLSEIEELGSVPWKVIFDVSVAGLKRRFLRSLITMFGVILGIAFLTYMLMNESILKALVAQNSDALIRLLQKNSVDIIAYSSGETDTMIFLLIGLSLLICLVGIINAMLMSVTERIKEIGTLKCLGALDSFIIKSYFIESSLQGVVGTVLGIALGFCVSIVLNLFYYGKFVFIDFPFAAIFFAVILSFLIGTIISVVAAIWPAIVAAKKEPVEAMRVEE
ncbi:MAG: FtsX-like permease family protein [Lentisphaeria bacterium]|nr:FtsX-like permease family protein [Lentisphaeria bacterium]NQZ68525.1 FtsX-like permease family protein [Lentisphaeria bacterium]